MRGCTHRAQELLPEYALGSLDPETMEMVENHLGVCASCSLEVRLIRRLEDREVPEPGPWFYETLPEKVTAEVESRRRKRKLSLIPVWVGGSMAAALAILMFLQHGSRMPTQTDIPNNGYIQSSGTVSLGLEEEIMSASAWAMDDLDQTIITDLKDASPDMVVAGIQVLGSEGYETMDVESIRAFENLIENASDGIPGGKVML